jgi:ribosomal protein S14
MKKLIRKDKKLRKLIKFFDKKIFVLKLISKNTNLFILLRYKALLALKNLLKYKSSVSISNRCITSGSRKRFNSKTLENRSIFTKKIYNGQIVGLERSTW